VKDNISTKLLPDTNIASHRSLDMYQNKHSVDIGSNCGHLKDNEPNKYNPFVSYEPRNDFDNVYSADATIHIQYDCHERLHDNQRVTIYVDDSLSVCLDDMNDMVGHQSTAIEVGDSDSTNEVVHSREATIYHLC
jgi:hypothetical protein